LERLGEIPEAFEAYRALATSQRVAAEKAEALGPRAEQAVRRRFDQALARGRIEDAEGLLSVLRSWRPDATATLLHERRWLEAKGDEAAELDLLRRLFAGGPAVVGSGEVGSGEVLPPARDREDPSAGEDVEPGWDEPTSELRRRWGRLEVTVGDIHSGVEIFETLSAAHQAADMPVDSSLADDLARAKFLYRLELLPPEAKAVARSPELDRAQLATLLYWLFPSVRFSEIDAPPIAQDILEEPARQEILRVLDLGLMGVDATRHRFEPRAPATRRGALAALLHLLTQSDPAVSCVAGEPVLPAGNRSRRWVCFKAAECGLIAEELDCLPAASLSGAEALEFVRRAQELAGSP
ncbi:MAG: hypothetical protein MI919_12215, partial [Holophagales bacterium]|nr:hypothetical protein [Holophagales bacterium]